MGGFQLAGQKANSSSGQTGGDSFACTGMGLVAELLR